MQGLDLIITVAVVGMVAHEAAHYVACRLAGAPARPTILWDGLATTPAIQTPERAHTPTTMRAVALAPLVVLVPSVVAGLALGLHTPTTGPPVQAAWILWCICCLPSGSDCKIIWHAGELETWREVWFGTHPAHAAAEGLGE